MRDLLKVLIVTAAALLVTYAAVILRGDTSVAVPPPESVAEQFARLVAAGRYDRALQHVEEWSGITHVAVRLAGDRLRERAGAVEHVAGEPGQIAGDIATASAVLVTEREGRVRFSLQLRRQRGVWKIVKWQID